MALPAASVDFTPGAEIQSQQFDDMFAQLYELLNGTSSTIRAYMRLNDAGNAVLLLNNIGGGPILQAQVSGVTKVSINGTGQIDSTVATGAAPIVVASTTRVDNLNVQYLNGIESTGFVQVTSGAATISGTTASLTLEDTTASAKDAKLQVDTNLFKIIDPAGPTDLVSLDLASGNLTVTGQVKSSTSAPSAAADLTRKDYVDGRVTRWGLTVFYPGLTDTGDPIPSFIVPEGVVDFTAVKMKLTYQAGTASGTTTITVKKNGVDAGYGALVAQSTGTVVTSSNFTSQAWVADDVITFHVTNSGLHEDVSVTIIGTQKVG